MGGLKITTVPWQPKLCATLKGCNSLTGETMASPFLQCPEVTKTTQTTIPSSELTMRFERFKTVSEVCKSLDVSASLSMHMALSGAGGSANASFANDIASSSSSVSLYVMIKKNYETEYVDNAEHLWIDRLGVKPSDFEDEEAFQMKYGDSFVCGSVRSIVMMGKMKFEYSKQSDKESVEAAVDAAVTAWGVATEASTSVKYHLEQAEENSKATFELYQTGIKDDCIVPITLTEMLDHVKAFTQNIDYDHAIRYQANLMPYKALHGYGGFKRGTATPSSIARDARAQAIAECAEDFYALKRCHNRLRECFRNPGDFRPPGEGRKSMTQREMYAWLCKSFDGTGAYPFVGSWMAKVRDLDDAVKHVAKLFEFSSDPTKIKVALPSSLGIFAEELPVRAGVRAIDPSVHEATGTLTWRVSPDSQTVTFPEMPHPPIVKLDWGAMHYLGERPKIFVQRVTTGSVSFRMMGSTEPPPDGHSVSYKIFCTKNETKMGSTAFVNSRDLSVA